MDDVVTTASTVAECFRVLRANGAADIEIWAIGRTVGRSPVGHPPEPPTRPHAAMIINNRYLHA